MSYAHKVDHFEDLSYQEKMILNPRDYFNSPAEVLTLGSLSYHQKLELLENWKQCLDDLMRSESEGMMPAPKTEKGEHLESEMEQVGKVLIRLTLTTLTP